MSIAAAPTVWAQAQWRPRATAHRARVEPWITAHLARRSRGEKHAIEDFLFDYYSYRPSALARWRPGWGVTVVGQVDEFEAIRGMVVRGDRAYIGDEELERRRLGIRQIADILTATQGRVPVLGCFGLHEWAMVYRQDQEQRRHPLPLRLGGAGTDRVVEQHRLACSHYDAYRFFTPAAAPLNSGRPTFAGRADQEQPGCLHANMDVYKWAYKLAPFTSAELVADSFELARRIRRLDMRASPYDVTSLGLTPVAIETPSGKAEYVAAQRGFAAEAAELRGRLIELCTTLLG